MNKNKTAALFLAAIMAASAAGCSSTISSEDGEVSEITDTSVKSEVSETTASDIMEMETGFLQYTMK